VGVHLGPLVALLLSMAAVAWSAFRHPFTSTVIDLRTGKVVGNPAPR
jgi:hypothetical protein